MYERWTHDPASVHASWQAFFENEKQGPGKGQSYSPPPAFVAATTSSPQQGHGVKDASDQVLVRRMQSVPHVAP